MSSIMRDNCPWAGITLGAILFSLIEQQESRAVVFLHAGITKAISRNDV